MILCVLGKDTGKQGKYTLTDQEDSFGDFEISVGDITYRQGSCITIVVDRGGKYGMLQNVIYRPMCEIGGKMEPHQGTILMLQSALHYVFSKYENLKYVTLNDKSTVATKDIHITAKRLLQQRQGWYQEWLGAVPDEKDMATNRLMKALARMQPSQEDKTIMNSLTWGKTRDIEEMARRYLGNESGSIIGTAWKITRKVALSYPVDIRTEMGGGSVKKKHIAPAKHMINWFHMWKRLTYEK